MAKKENTFSLAAYQRWAKTYERMITLDMGRISSAVEELKKHRTIVWHFDGHAAYRPELIPNEPIRPIPDRALPHLSVSAIIIPEAKNADGLLIRTTTDVWLDVIARLKLDWQQAYQIPPEVWEGIVAGAFTKAGYDEVTLTPRSGDFGRDVIAVKRGVGSIKIIGSVKAFAPDRKVGQDDVRALLGVLAGEPDASKALLATTADFAPRLRQDKFIAPFLDTRLELMNGAALLDWLVHLTSKR